MAMWEDDWALLGIEPTTELGAIKKAYALKLKVTRPDDDAQAYQALRGAYERVQAWVKWQPAEQDGPDQPSTVEMPPEIATAPPAPNDLPRNDAATHAPPPASVAALQGTMRTPELQPSALIEQLELAWRQGGSAALLARWPETRANLDAQALDQRAVFSSAFARWVLRLPQLPDSFLAALNNHFGWLGDYRLERQIGTELTQALHDELDARLQRPVGDPRLLAMAEPLRQLKARHDKGQTLSSQALALLLQPLLARIQHQLGERLMHRLGLDLLDQHLLRSLTTRAAWLRGILLTLLFSCVCALSDGSRGESSLRVISWAVVCLMMLGGAMLIGSMLYNGFALQTPTRRIGVPLQAWRRHRSQPWLGLGLGLAAAALMYVDPEATSLSRWMNLPSEGAWLQPLLIGLLALTGLMLAWPLEPGHGLVSTGLSPLLMTFFVIGLRPALPVVTCALLALTWMLLAAAVQEGRVRAPGVLEWPLRPLLNSFNLVERWGLIVAMLPAFCAWAYAMRPGEKPSGSGLFLTWVFANLAVGWLQARAESWALQRLARAS